MGFFSRLFGKPHDAQELAPRKRTPKAEVLPDVTLIRQLIEQTRSGALHWSLQSNGWFISSERRGRIVMLSNPAPLETPKMQIRRTSAPEIGDTVLAQYVAPFPASLSNALCDLLDVVLKSNEGRHRKQAGTALREFVTANDGVSGDRCLG